jgi:hypothetical protein
MTQLGVPEGFTSVVKAVAAARKSFNSIKWAKKQK